MSNNIYKEKYHYVYLLIDENHKKYGGVRSCKCLPENDSYMSSSNYVNEAIESGITFKKYIIKTFDTRKEANEYESDWLNNVKAGKNDNWYNQINAYPNWCREGKKHTQESKKKMYGRKHTKETKEKIKYTFFKKGQIPWNKGKKGCYSEEQLQKYRDSHKGKKATLETRKKMSISQKGRKHTEESKRKIGVASKERHRLKTIKEKEK